MEEAGGALLLPPGFKATSAGRVALMGTALTAAASLATAAPLDTEAAGFPALAEAWRVLA